MKIIIQNRLSIVGMLLIAGLSSQTAYSQSAGPKLKRVDYVSPSLQIKQLVGSPANKSLLKQGERLNVVRLKQERKRLINYLQREGVAVDSSEVQVLVDTTAFKPEYVVYFAIKRPKNSVTSY